MTPSLPIGLAAALVAAILGATWQVATRHGVTTTLNAFDLALLRYGVPALLLLPALVLLLRRPAKLVGAGWSLLLLVLGSGLPFGLLAMGGASFAPVAHMGALLPGTMPIFTGLLAALFLGDRLSGPRLAGFAVIVAGVVLIAGGALLQRGDQTWIGDLMFLAAGMAWSVYSVAFQKSGLTPWQGMAWVAAVSAILVLPLWALCGGPARIAAAPWTDLALQAVVQGALSGVVALWAFTLSIRHLGAARAALSGALVPVLSALGGYVMLGERPGLVALAGAGAIGLGIVLAGLRPPAAAPGTARRPAAAG